MLQGRGVPFNCLPEILEMQVAGCPANLPTLRNDLIYLVYYSYNW